MTPTITTTTTKTMASLFEALDNVRRLWGVFAVGPAPEDKELAGWMSQFTEEELMHAFRRVGAKFRNGYDNPEILHRYCTGVLVGERKRVHENKETQ
jgi:hypothetical protein